MVPEDKKIRLRFDWTFHYKLSSTFNAFLSFLLGFLVFCFFFVSSRRCQTMTLSKLRTWSQEIETTNRKKSFCKTNVITTLSVGFSIFIYFIFQNCCWTVLKILLMTVSMISVLVVDSRFVCPCLILFRRIRQEKSCLTCWICSKSFTDSFFFRFFLR